MDDDYAAAVRINKLVDLITYMTNEVCLVLRNSHMSGPIDIVKKQKKLNNHQVLPYCAQVYRGEAKCMSWIECCWSMIAFSAAYQ